MVAREIWGEDPLPLTLLCHDLTTPHDLATYFVPALRASKKYRDYSKFVTGLAKEKQLWYNCVTFFSN